MTGKDIYEAIDRVKDEYIDKVYTSQNEKNAGLSKKKFYLLVFAATLVIAILTACTAEVYKWDGRLSKLLNLSSEQKSFVDGMWYNINETKTSKGITAALNSVLTDDNSMFLLYDVTLPDTMDMDRGYDFEISQIDELDWFSFGGGMPGSLKNRIVNVDKKKHTISYLMEFSASSGSIKEQKLRFWFKNLRSYKVINDAIADERLEKAVDFVFYADIAYTPNVINYSFDKQVTGLLNKVKVKKITVTPISLTIQASGETKVTLWDTEKNEHEKDFVSAIILKDGRKAEVSGSETRIDTLNIVSYKSMFKEIINPKDIAEIEFFQKERVAISDLQYTTGVEASMSGNRMARLKFEISIFIALICMAINAAATLHFCKSDIYKSFEKIQSKKQKKGKEYTFDDFCSFHKKRLKISEVFYMYCIAFLLLGAGRLTFLIITNWFVAMTVLMDAVCIGLIFLMAAAFRESKKERKYLGRL